jgi:hypothetical protein
MSGVSDPTEFMRRSASPKLLRTGLRWDNVTPVNTAAAELDIAVSVDAVLLCATHDGLRSPSTLANVFRHGRPGARVAATGGKWAAPWLWPLNVLVFQLHRPHVTQLRRLRSPMAKSAGILPGSAGAQDRVGHGLSGHRDGRDTMLVTET